VKIIRNGLLLALPALLFPVLAQAQAYGGYPATTPPWWQIELMNRFWPSVVAALLGFTFGAFWSEKAKPFRAFIALGFVCLLALSNMWLGCVAFFFLAAGLAFKLLQNRTQAADKTTFGSAEWASLDHLESKRLIGTDGLLLGAFPYGKNSAPLHYTGNRHLLTVAPTRSGKGVSAIIPNLLTYTGSAVIIDPKGENAMITGARREVMGHEVHVVDPWGITTFPQACFNPLDWLQAADEDVSENAMMLADSIIAQKEGASDPFWNEEAKALLTGVILYVALSPEESHQRHLGRVRDIINSGERELFGYLEKMVEHQNPVVSSTAKRTAGKDSKLLANVLATLQSHTHFLDSPRIRESLSRSDFRFEDLKIRPVTVYLVLPADRLEAFGRWLRLLIQQAITVNARSIAVKPDKPILFLLDEMAALGRLTMVEQAYGLMAGFGMQLWGIVQDLGQLERIYGRSWETFISNSGVLQYMGSRDLRSAEYFAKLCGVATIENFSWSRSIAKNFGTSSGYSQPDNPMNGGGGNVSHGTNSGTSDSSSYNYNSIQRPLAYPDELMTLHEDRQLLFVENFNPIKARKVRWYEDPALSVLGAKMGTGQNPALPSRRISALK
jgi:type IV secretion system protein VirD4